MPLLVDDFIYSVFQDRTENQEFVLFELGVRRRSGEARRANSGKFWRKYSDSAFNRSGFDAGSISWVCHDSRQDSPVTDIRAPIFVTKNKILASLNTPDAFRLALVLVDNDFTQRRAYVPRFFDRELGLSETAVVFNIDRLLSGQGATDD